MATPIIKWPFGAATVETLNATGTQAITIVNEMTIVNGATVIATGNRTLNLTVGELVGIGAMLVIKTKTTATTTTIFGTAMLGATITGVAGKTFVATFVYDGSAFVNSGTPVQID